MTPLWQPTAAAIERSRMDDFRRYINSYEQQQLADYQQLHAWSVAHSERFWLRIWDYFAVLGQRGDTIVSHADKLPGAQWFPDSQLNFAENLLRYRDDRLALIFRGEDGSRQQLSYAELYSEVAACAKAMRNHGIVAGDRVAALMPNCIETVIAMLAASSIGAIWSSCSPDFGVQGVLDRFGQITPKLFITVEGYCYNGKVLDISDKVNHIQAQLPSLCATVLVRFSRAQHRINRAIEWEQFLDRSSRAPEFTQLAFNSPLYIMFSSGTTGVPKCIVHGAGGTLLQHLKEHALHTNLDRDDVLFYFTTCGWMMWNWLVSGLAQGATLVLFDGSPFAPTPEILWDIAEQERISVFGTSAKYLSALEKAGVKPRDSHNLSNLRSILTTGSVLSPESFDFVYRDINSNLCLSSISGGTDIISCFALGNPTLPVYRGQLQCRGLGLNVQVYNDKGQAVNGEKGELVCSNSFPEHAVRILARQRR